MVGRKLPYLFFFFYRICMCRTREKPVRARILRKWCLISVSYLKFYFVFSIYHCILPTPPPHSTLHISHCTLRTPHFILHTVLFALLIAFFTLHSSHCTFHTALFTSHTSHCTLHTPYFISSELFSPYPSSFLLISSLLIYHLSFHKSFPSITTKEFACAVRQPGPCVRALCEAVAALLSKKITCARPRRNATPNKHFPHISYCTLLTPHSTLHTCTSSQLMSSELFSASNTPCPSGWTMLAARNSSATLPFLDA